MGSEGWKSESKGKGVIEVGESEVRLGVDFVGILRRNLIAARPSWKPQSSGHSRYRWRQSRGCCPRFR